MPRQEATHTAMGRGQVPSTASARDSAGSLVGVTAGKSRLSSTAQWGNDNSEPLPLIQPNFTLLSCQTFAPHPVPLRSVPLLLPWGSQDEAALRHNLNVVLLLYFPANDGLEEDFSAEARSALFLYVLWVLGMCWGRPGGV